MDGSSCCALMRKQKEPHGRARMISRPADLAGLRQQEEVSPFRFLVAAVAPL